MTCKTSDSLCGILFTHMLAATSLMNTKQILHHWDRGRWGFEATQNKKPEPSTCCKLANVNEGPTDSVPRYVRAASHPECVFSISRTRKITTLRVGVKKELT
jgi:hypothetical protein